MDLFFPEDHLQRMSPEETRILSLAVQPYPDQQRLRVEVEMTPFTKRPHLDFVISDPAGAELASATIVEPLTWKLEFTMHLRSAGENTLTLEARLYYPDGPSAAPEARTFHLGQTAE